MEPLKIATCSMAGLGQIRFPYVTWWMQQRMVTPLNSGCIKCVIICPPSREVIINLKSFNALPAGAQPLPQKQQMYFQTGLCEKWKEMCSKLMIQLRQCAPQQKQWMGHLKSEPHGKFCPPLLGVPPRTKTYNKEGLDSLHSADWWTQSLLPCNGLLVFLLVACSHFSNSLLFSALTQTSLHAVLFPAPTF